MYIKLIVVFENSMALGNVFTINVCASYVLNQEIKE